MSRSDREHGRHVATFTGSAAAVMRRAVTVVIFVICGLTFSFGFGNGYAVGILLGVPQWIAPLVAPAVDLSVVALLASMQYLRATGVERRLAGPRALLLFCGFVTLGLNVAHPILVGAFGQACFYAISPLLLIGWSEVGPKLLASLHGTVSTQGTAVLEPSPAVRDGSPAVPPELVVKAKQFDLEHREATGRPISRDRLRAGEGFERRGGRGTASSTGPPEHVIRNNDLSRSRWTDRRCGILRPS